MKKLFFAIAILSFSIQGAYAQDMHARIDSIMNYYASEYNFNGVALVADQGKIVFEQAYGYKDIGKKEKNDNNTIFPVGTVTTPFTAEIIFQLAHEHKLGLDDKVKKYFPDFPKGDSITIRHLLTHTAGLSDYFMFDGMMIKNDTLPMKEDSLMELFTKRRPQGVPGKHFHYSNSDYLMLGYIIEKVTKKSYYQVCRERMLNPAGMTSSGFDYRALKSAEKSWGYKHLSEDEKKIPVVDSTILGGSAALYTTANDLFSWHKALQSDKFLSKKTQDSMYIPFQKNYAYGWYSDTQFNKISVIHGGQISGSSSLLLRIPGENFCIVIMQNIAYPAYDNYAISHTILSAFYDTAFVMPTAIPEVKLSNAALSKFEGEYAFSSGVAIVVSVQGNELHGHNIPLKGDPPNAPDFDMIPISDNKFKTKSLNAVIEFQADMTGNISQLVLHQPEEPHQHRHPLVAKKKTGTTDKK